MINPSLHWLHLRRAQLLKDAGRMATNMLLLETTRHRLRQLVWRIWYPTEAAYHVVKLIASFVHRGVIRGAHLSGISPLLELRLGLGEGTARSTATKPRIGIPLTIHSILRLVFEALITHCSLHNLLPILVGQSLLGLIIHSLVALMLNLTHEGFFAVHLYFVEARETIAPVTFICIHETAFERHVHHILRRSLTASFSTSHYAMLRFTRCLEVVTDCFEAEAAWMLKWCDVFRENLCARMTIAVQCMAWRISFFMQDAFDEGFRSTTPWEELGTINDHSFCTLIVL